ncbi:MAG: mechanosensitive ion channel domain-containing protein [Planctomycetota bacterium]
MAWSEIEACSGESEGSGHHLAGIVAPFALALPPENPEEPPDLASFRLIWYFICRFSAATGLDYEDAGLSELHMDGMWIAGRDFTTQLALSRRLLACIGWLVPFLALIGVLGSESAYAQPATNGTTSQLAVTVESVEALRRQAAESPDPDADAKQKIEAACVQALDGLKRIAEVAGQAEQFRRDTDDLQQRVATLRRRLAEPQRDRPSPPPDLTLPELEQEVSRREVALAELKAAQAKSEAEPSTRANRRRELRTLLLSAIQRIADTQKQLDTAAPPGEPAPLTTARRAALQVRRVLIEAEQPALQNELAKYDAEDAVDFLRLERDVHTREVTIASSELASLQGLLSRRRAADSAAAVQRARDALASAPVALRTHAEENITLAEAAHALSQPLEETRRKLEGTKARLEAVQKQFTMTQQRVSDIGLTGSIGALLRRERIDLPDSRRLRRNVQDRKTLIENTQYELFEYDDVRSESVEAMLQRVLSSVSVNGQVEGENLEASARLLVEQCREYLDGVIRNCSAYLDTLFELDATEQRLIRETERYEDYIDERVLWIRSNRTLFSSFEIDASDTWALDPARWTEVGQQLGKDVRSHPLVYGIGVVAFALLIWQKPRLRRELQATSQIAARGTCTQFSPTLRAAFLTLMLAVAWPGLVFFLGWRLNVFSNGSQFARALSQGLFAVAWVYFPLELLRRVCRQRGLADSHFDWPASTIGVFRANLKWATLLGLPVAFVTSVLYSTIPEHGVDSIERVFFVAGMVILAVFMRRVLRPDSGIFREYLVAHPGGWFDRLKPVWYWGCVLVPLTIAGMTVAGYYYTAQQLTWRFYATFVFIVGAQLLRAFLLRLLLVRRRAISIQQARERRAAEVASREQSADSAQLGPNQVVPIEEMQPDVAANTEQSQRLIQTGLIAASFIGMWLIWVNVLPALRILEEWPVWTTTVTATAETNAVRGPARTLAQPQGSEAAVTATAQPVDVLRTVTVADIGLAILIGIVTFVCARNIPGLMEISLLQRLPLDMSIRYAVTSITSYAIVLLGVILAFNAISVGWSKVQWLATALTFGLAFGLQEIFANFVAGLILLFERPIRLGDVVTVDDVTGVVSRIRIRATTITNWDRKEYLIPNKEFITGRMLNWTLSDKTNRIVVNVGVAYGSDVERAKELLLQICNDHPLILDDPPTLVTFEGFGDNSLNLVVRTFLPDLNNRLQVIDELHTAIDKAFRQAAIEIAFPQRDLHLRSVDRSVWSGFQRETDQKTA